METQTPIDSNEFLPGTPVIYAMHGKCTVLGTETRELGGKPIQFYRLEVKKSALSRSGRQEPAIWVPVDTAKDRGLRVPMSKTDAEAAMKILLSREYYFKASEPWTTIQHQLELTIRHEGGLGLAKVASFLYVLKRKQVVPTPEVNKLQETVNKLLFKELSEALNEPVRILEEKALKGFRAKLIPDS